MTLHHLTGANQSEIWPLVRSFHYSRRMPSNIQHCYAVRSEGGLFGHTGEVLAGIIFSIPPTRWSEDVLELSRLVRREDFSGSLSQLISFACNHLRKRGHHLLVSFADRTQSHHGGIYQASGWNYDGCRERRMDGLIINGTFKPGRSCNSAWGTQSPDRLKAILPNAEIIPHFDDGKHLYWRALTVAGKTRAKRLELKSLPYPKPSAARLLDAPLPNGASSEHTRRAAPIIKGVDLLADALDFLVGPQAAKAK
jgi:hypothetical protein